MGWNGRSIGVLGVLGAVAFVILTGPLSSIAWSGVPYSLVGISCTIATIVGIRRHKPPHAAAWWLIAASHALWNLADIIFYVLAALGDADFPTPADALYVIGYFPLVLGMMMLVHRRRQRHLSTLVDGAVVATGLSLLGWMLFVGPVMANGDNGVVGHVTGGVYLGADVLLVALAGYLIACSTRLSPSSWAALAAIALLLIGDSTYVWGSVLPGWAYTILMLGWLLSNVAWSAAAMHPSMADLSNHEAPTTIEMTPRRAGVLLVAVLLAPATLVVMQVIDLESDYAVAAASALMSVLVVVRLGIALRTTAASLMAREEMRRALEHQASHDPLTGLSGRSASIDHLTAALAAAKAGQFSMALLFVDLDGFKGVNDAHGHRVGDGVLCEVATRLRRAVREGDVAGRLGGDEFVVVLTVVADVEDVLTVAQRVIDSVAEPIVTHGHTVTVGASIGAAVSDNDSEPTSLLHEADTAAYRAKARGRGRVELYDHALRAADAERDALEEQLRGSWPVSGLELELVPILTSSSRAPWQAEVALMGDVRWRRRGANDVEPTLFLTASERAGRTGDLARWALDEGLRQRLAAGAAAPAVWVPMPAGHLAAARVIEDVTQALIAHGTAPSHLAVRTWGPSAITSHVSVKHLSQLRSAGVGVVLEGFTAQHTGLGDLRTVPATALVLRADDLPDAAVLALFVGNARSLGLDVILDGAPRADIRSGVEALGLPIIERWAHRPVEALQVSGDELNEPGGASGWGSRRLLP